MWLDHAEPRRAESSGGEMGKGRGEEKGEGRGRLNNTADPAGGAETTELGRETETTTGDGKRETGDGDERRETRDGRWETVSSSWAQRAEMRPRLQTAPAI